ncbi:hypothetical protein H0B56_17165 [Haloechinothrix sp. YIM 98757]|uniref:Uncharacterized protein n=1 Tax=Haloechinothrix aidingensis TaxID=2752311 RepID=A0A838ADJ1_9PSEU|nr:hypothetical protein [Haloechinothrix aidingensis]MBA0127283.1 hypothetical protein [Haloechinothrix aidingensis]
MIATAGTVRRLPEEATEWHVRRLATELARAVFDLDARMRAGLAPPRAWQHAAPTEQTHAASKSQDTEYPEGTIADNTELDDTPDRPVFYWLPAADLDEGMSTDDGQDIVSVSVADDWVFVDVYTPRSDDPEQDAQNRDETECRMYRPDELVGMATFPDTAIDGSSADHACPHPHADPRTDDAPR